MLARSLFCVIQQEDLLPVFTLSTVTKLDETYFQNKLQKNKTRKEGISVHISRLKRQKVLL